MAEIDLLVAIDATGLIERFGTPVGSDQSPLILGGDDPDRYITMLVRDKNVLQNQKGSELNFSADTGDEIRWRERAVSMGGNYSVLFYRYEELHGTHCLGPITAQNISIKIPVPPNGSALDQPPQWVESRDFFWSTHCEQAGRVTYRWAFKIYERGNHDPLGYYIWDPYIVISE